MKDKRKKLIIIMSVILVGLIVIGVVIGVSQTKKQKELEEQGIIYQDGAEGVEIWDDEDVMEEADSQAETSEDGDDVDVDSDDNSNNADSTNSDNNTKSSGTSSSESNNKKDDKKDSEGTGNNNSGGGKDNNSSTQKENNKKDPVKVPSAGKMTYEEYISMSPAKQEEYFEKFESEQEFFDWYREAKAEYDKKNQGNVVEGGSIDIGDYMD